MVLLTQLPLEIVNHVLSFVDPEDLPRVNTTCQYLYHAVKDNKALFRAVYLRHLVSSRAVFAISVFHVTRYRIMANHAGYLGCTTTGRTTQLDSGNPRSGQAEAHMCRRGP